MLKIIIVASLAADVLLVGLLAVSVFRVMGFGWQRSTRGAIILRAESVTCGSVEMSRGCLVVWNQPGYSPVKGRPVAPMEYCVWFDQSKRLQNGQSQAAFRLYYATTWEVATAFEMQGDIIIIPVWSVILLLACPAIVGMLWRWWFGSVAVNGLCPQCGYDLRATPKRCPECGFTVNE